MGCSFCQNSPPDHEPSQRFRSPLAVPSHCSSETHKGFSPTKHLKLRQSNYVVVCNARLRDLYEIQSKVGEGAV